MDKFFQRTILFLCALHALVSFAQVTRGGALLKRQYQTYGALTYFVDPTGSDSNACTATGTSACATLQGVINKIPRNVRHNVTISVATGTYTGLTAITGFNIGPTVDQTVTGAATIALAVPLPSIAITGASWVNATLGTGTATGTLTATPVAPTVSPIAFGTLTDSGQAWTPGALKGMYFNPTSGTALNNRVVIADNTATTISLIMPVAGLASGDTYAIQLPGASIGPVYVSNITGAAVASTGLVLLDSLTITSTTSAFPAVSASQVGMTSQPTGASGGAYVGLALRRLRLMATGTASASLAVGGYAAVTTSSTGGNYLESATSSAGIAPLSITTGFFKTSYVGLGPIYIRNSGTGGGGLDLSRVMSSTLTTTAISVFEMTSAQSGFGIVQATSDDSWTTGNWYVRAAGSTVCVQETLQIPAPRRARYCSLRLENCTTGVLTTGAFLSVAPTNGSPCLNFSFTTSGVTNELNIDGTNYSSRT